VHLVGFVKKKFITMHGDVNVKFSGMFLSFYSYINLFASLLVMKYFLKKMILAHSSMV